MFWDIASYQKSRSFLFSSSLSQDQTSYHTKLQALQPQIEHRVRMVLRVYKLQQHVA